MALGQLDVLAQLFHVNGILYTMYINIFTLVEQK